MSTHDKARPTFAENQAWSAKYHAELHRLEAANGGWSREIADQARAFADSGRAPSTRASNVDNLEEVAVDWDAAFGTDDIKAKNPSQTPSPTDDFWDEAFGDRGQRY